VVLELDPVSFAAGSFAEAVADDQMQLAEMLGAEWDQHADDVPVRSSDWRGRMQDLVALPATSLGNDLFAGERIEGATQGSPADLQFAGKLHLAGQTFRPTSLNKTLTEHADGLLGERETLDRSGHA
jgi:hypothetical protein